MDGEQSGLSTVSDNVGLPDETHMSGENRINESYEIRDDGGKIMVGTDVFVDGMSSNDKEDNFLSEDIGGFDSHILDNREENDTADFPGFTALTSVGNVGKLGESELEVSGSRIGHDNAISKEVEVSFTESVAVTEITSHELNVLNVGMLNPEIEEMTVTTTETTQSIIAQTEEVSERASVEVSEGMVTTSDMLNPQIHEMPVTTSHMTDSITTQTEEVTERVSVVVSEDANLENRAMEPSGVGGIGSDVVFTDEKETKGKEFDDGENLETPVIEGEIGSGVAIIVESAIKDEGTENNNAKSVNCASTEHLNDPVEASVAEETVTSYASHDESSLEDTRASYAGQIIPNKVSVNPDCDFLDLDQGGVEKVELVEGNDVLHVDHNQIDPSHSVNMKCTASASGNVDPTCGGDEIVTDGMSEGGVSCTNVESAKLGLASESKNLILGRDGPQSDLKDENINYEETDVIDNASHEESSETEEAMDVDFDVVLDFKDKDFNPPGTSNNGILENVEESNETEEAMDVDFDVVLDFKDKDFNPPGTSNNGILENVEDLGIDDFESEPADIDDTVESNLKKGPIDNLRAGSDDNLAHTRDELVEADSGTCIDQPVIDTPMTEVTNDQNTETSQVKIMDADEPSKYGEGFDAEFTENHVADNNYVANAEIELDNIVEECESPQIKDVEVSLQETETTHDGIDVLENISLLPNEIDGATAFSDSNLVNASSVISGNTELASSNDKTNQSRGPDENSGSNGDDHVSEDHTSEMDMEQETEPDQEYRQEEEIDEPLSETDTTKLTNKDRMKSSNNLRMSQLGYLSENDGNFAVSDLVWGKVKSHPWWPCQIFNHEDASEKAMKYYKKDSYLVAYFGDRTFAWNDASSLKPFRSQFSQTVKQSTSEMFQNAVDCALEEVSRRVELGLSCSCTPKNAFGEIATQIVDNSGIRKESSRRNGVDQSCKATNFEPGEFLQYVRYLAPRACSGVDHLDVVIAQAQVSAFCRFKGYHVQTEFPTAGDLLEDDAATEKLSDEVVYSRKGKRVPKENVRDDFEYSPDDEDESIASLYPSRKRKAVDSLADWPSDKRVNVKSAKKSNEYPKPSFKIGECIRRVASQLTGSTAVVKSTTDELGSNGLINEHSEEPSSLIDMLLRLELLAQSPNKQYSFKDRIISFFSGFRNSIVVNKRGGRKRKAGKMVGMSAEEFEFDDVSDSYWTDRIVQNYSEKQLLHDNEIGAGEEPVTHVDGGEKNVKSGGRKSHSRRKFFRSSHLYVTDEVDEKVKRLKQESSPAELILNFAERKFIPSEINLNKTFRRFGALMESETEVDHESGRARVIFKRGSDAEIARNSAQSFNIFGPVLVNYEIGYSPLISVKISNIALPQVQEDGALML